MNKNKIIVNYFNDIILPGKYHNATKFTRINLAKGFSALKEVERINFYFITDSKEGIKKIRHNFDEKIKIKPIIIPWIEDVSFVKREKTIKSKFNKWYRIIIANRIITVIFFWYILRSNNKLIFLRGHKTLVACFFARIFTKFDFSFELHNFEFGKGFLKDFFYSKLMKWAMCSVTITDFTKRNWIEHGIDREKILVFPSSVDLNIFDKVIDSKNSLREGLDLSKNKKIVTYVGGLYKHRGIEDIIHAAAKNHEILFLIIGGTKEEVMEYENYAKKENKGIANISFLGFIEHSLTPKYLKASDILLAPYSKKVSTANHMSPVKIYEYLASKVPAIVSDLPRIKEMVSKEEVIFFKADNAEDLSDKIRAVFKEYKFYLDRSVAAHKIVTQYSWKRRAEKIISMGVSIK